MAVRSKLSIVLNVLLTLLTVAVFAVAVLLFLSIKEPTVTGHWQDVDDDDYFMIFSSDGTYRESTYNTQLAYSVYGDTLILNDMAGHEATTYLHKNLGGKMTVSLYGKTRVLQPMDGKAKISSVDTSKAGAVVGAYQLVSGCSEDVSLRLYDQFVYKLNIGDTTHTGRFARSTDGTLLLHIPGDELWVECLKPYDYGYVFGEMEAELDSESVKLNAIEDRGTVLIGDVKDTFSDTVYYFTRDNHVVMTPSGKSAMECNYFVDSSGIITITDSAGLGISDTMYYSQTTGKVYRYVFGRDEWFEFLSNVG